MTMKHTTWTPKRPQTGSEDSAAISAAIELLKKVAGTRGGSHSANQQTPRPFIRLPEWIKHVRVICKSTQLHSPLPLVYAGIRKLASGRPAAYFELPNTTITAWVVPADVDPQKPLVAHSTGRTDRATDFLVVR